MYAVITGDIVASSQLKHVEREALLKLLKDIFAQVRQEEHSIEKDFDVFRGDSFQVLLNQPESALRIALYIRLKLMTERENDQAHDWDARMAIGLGEVNYWGEEVATSDGPAFRHSGPILDEMKGSERLRISSEVQEFTEEMKVATALLDGVSSRWTSKQARVMLESMRGKTQNEIASSLNISQPAVSKMLRIAHWEAVEMLLQRYENLIKKAK